MMPRPPDAIDCPECEGSGAVTVEIGEDDPRYFEWPEDQALPTVTETCAADEDGGCGGRGWVLPLANPEDDPAVYRDNTTRMRAEHQREHHGDGNREVGTACTLRVCTVRQDLLDERYLRP
jgi:hypothetical protein